MKTRKIKVFYVLLLNLILSSCGAGQYLASTATPSPTLTSLPTVTHTPPPTIAPTPTVIGGGTGKVLFTYARDGFVIDFPNLKGQQNVFMSNLDGTNLVSITDGLRGYNDIEALSPDGSKLLVSSFRTESRSDDPNAILYLFDLNSIDNEPIQIAQGFSQFSSKPSAGWVNDSTIVYLGKGEGGYGIYAIKTDGSEPTKIDITSKTPEKILAIDSQRVYWSHGEHKNYTVRYGDYNDIWWTNIDGASQGKLESNGIQVEYFSGEMGFSPDGRKVAWVPAQPEPECDTFEKHDELFKSGEEGKTCSLLYIAELSDLDHPIKIPLIYPSNASKGNYEIVFVSAIKWASNTSGMYLLFGGMLRGGWYPPKMYYVDVPNSEILSLPEFPSLYDYDMGDRQQGSYYRPFIFGLSPDGRKIIISKITTDETTKAVLIDLETMAIDNDFLNGLKPDTVRNIYLLP